MLLTACDYFVPVLIHNQSTAEIMVDINDRGRPVTVGPGQVAGDGTEVNEKLTRIRITTRTDPSVDIVKEFTRSGGYHVFVTVTGPPLEVTVETRSIGQPAPTAFQAGR